MDISGRTIKNFLSFAQLFTNMEGLFLSCTALKTKQMVPNHFQDIFFKKATQIRLKF